MNSPIDISLFRVPAPAIHSDAGSISARNDAVGAPFLNRPVEWMRYCVACDGEHLFVADRVCASGLVGRCSRCGDELVTRFSRMQSDAWEPLT